MAEKRKSSLKEKIRTVAGILLILASLTEVMGIAGEYGTGVAGRIHLLFAVVSFAAALLVLFNVSYAAYASLPVALGIFFYEVYHTVSIKVSFYSVLSGTSFFAAALLCFMLIRANKT